MDEHVRMLHRLRHDELVAAAERWTGELLPV